MNARKHAAPCMVQEMNTSTEVRPGLWNIEAFMPIPLSGAYHEAAQERSASHQETDVGIDRRRGNCAGSDARAIPSRDIQKTRLRESAAGVSPPQPFHDVWLHAWFEFCPRISVFFLDSGPCRRHAATSTRGSDGSCQLDPQPKGELRMPRNWTRIAALAVASMTDGPDHPTN